MSGRKPLISRLALLLLLLQALVVPAHRHAGGTPSAASGAAIAAPVKQSPDHPADCPVCREVAHAGQYLTPGDVVLPVAATGTLVPAASALARVVATAASHSWRSRAPPVFGLS